MRTVQALPLPGLRHAGVMCGRYAAAKDQAVLVEEFGVDTPAEQELAPDYNVAPTKAVYVIRDDRSTPEVHRQMLVARWGLIPSWAKDPAIGARMINARVETVREKPAFREAYARRRCIVPADGYYEWYTPPGDDVPRGRSGRPVKQPFYIHRADGACIAMAGLLSWWRSGEDWTLSMAVLTTEANEDLARIHDRMPMTVPREHWEQWLDTRWDGADAVGGVLCPAEPGELVAYPVSTAVNSVRNNGPALIDPLPAA